MKLYTPIFPEGLYGTFLSYFISQHDGFYKYNVYSITHTNRFISHMELPDLFHVFYKNSLLDNDFDKYMNIALTNASVSSDKYIFKLKEHYYRSPIDFYHKLNQYDITLIVLSTKHGDIFDKRIISNAPEVSDVKMYNLAIESYTKSIKELQTLYNCVEIDPIEILYFKNKHEYFKLCDYINVKPISNWDKICDRYLDRTTTK